jgi:hypothetical protein
MLKNLIKILALVLFASSAEANSLNLNLGTSVSYLKSTDNKLNYVNHGEYLIPRSLSTGLTYISPEICLSVTTNRLFSKQYSRDMINDNETKFKSKERSITDALTVGYQFERFIPYVFASNSNFKKEVYYETKKIADVDINSVIYGVGVTYLYNQDISFSLSFALPNEDVEFGTVFGVSYNINLL